MRLSQLARKLEISPSDLINFFEKSKIGKYNSHNNKIEEKDLLLALNHFRPQENEVETSEQTSHELVSFQDNQDEKKKEVVNPAPALNSTLPENDSVDSESSKYPEEEIEVISMPKIKLEGVKVVGKIDLPEPVKKLKDESNIQSTNQNKGSENVPPTGIRDENREVRKRLSKQKIKHKNSRRELSYEEKLKREERQKIQEQQRTKKLKKEQKKQHYIKNIQSNINPTKRKKKNRNIDDQEIEPIMARPHYKNPIKKFWAWLNGKYDR
jgi:hypothetical protein